METGTGTVHPIKVGAGRSTGLKLPSRRACGPRVSRRKRAESVGLIRDEDAFEIRERLKGMTDPVKLVHFTQELNLEYGIEARQLVEEVASLSDKLSAEVYNFLLDKEKVAKYAIDKVPATVVRNGKDYGIRFYGIPAGYEFATLLDAILKVSTDDSGLSVKSKEKITRISKPLHLEVFVTPT
jgi:glutaredoxin-like protein